MKSVPIRGDVWSEIDDLYCQLVDRLYRSKKPTRLGPLCRRLEFLLKREDRAQESILGQECRALIFEARGDLVRAIQHRRKEIRLRKQLIQSGSGMSSKAFAILLKHAGYEDLADRFELLAILYQDAGQLKNAIRALWQSRELCELHNIKFDGKALLRDYLAEHRSLLSAK